MGKRGGFLSWAILIIVFMLLSFVLRIFEYRSIFQEYEKQEDYKIIDIEVSLLRPGYSEETARKAIKKSDVKNEQGTAQGYSEETARKPIKKSDVKNEQGTAQGYSEETARKAINKSDVNNEQGTAQGDFSVTILQKGVGRVLNLAEVKFFDRGRQINTGDLVFTLSSGNGSICNDGNLETFCRSEDTDLNPRLKITSRTSFDEVAVFNAKDSLHHILGALFTATHDGGEHFLFYELFRTAEEAYTFYAKHTVHFEPSAPIRISCDDGTIKLVQAVYGNCRGTCRELSECTTDVTLHLAPHCDGASFCNLDSSRTAFHALCPAVENYVIVQYNCLIKSEELPKIEKTKTKKQYQNAAPPSTTESLYASKAQHGCGGYLCQHTENLWSEGCILPTATAFKVCDDDPECVCVGRGDAVWAPIYEEVLQLGTQVHENSIWTSYVKLFPGHAPVTCDAYCSPEPGSCDKTSGRCLWCVETHSPDESGICQPEPEERIQYSVTISHQSGSEKMLNLAEVEVFNKGNQISRSNLKFFLLNKGSRYSRNLCNDGNTRTFCHLDAESRKASLTVHSNVEFDMVMIKNRQDCCQHRMVGVTVTATVDAGITWMLSQKFTDIKDNYIYKASLCKDFPSDWTDSGGQSCDDYRTLNFCTPDGEYGLNWDRHAWKTFRYFSNNGINAAQACCACGGGVGDTKAVATIARNYDPE